MSQLNQVELVVQHAYLIQSESLNLKCECECGLFICPEMNWRLVQHVFLAFTLNMSEIGSSMGEIR